MSPTIESALDHAGPAKKGIDTNAALGGITLATAENHGCVAALRRVLGKVAVVAHHDKYGIVGNAELTIKMGNH